MMFVCEEGGIIGNGWIRHGREGFNQRLCAKGTPVNKAVDIERTATGCWDIGIYAIPEVGDQQLLLLEQHRCKVK